MLTKKVCRQQQSATSGAAPMLTSAEYCAFVNKLYCFVTKPHHPREGELTFQWMLLLDHLWNNFGRDSQRFCCYLDFTVARLSMNILISYENLPSLINQIVADLASGEFEQIVATAIQRAGGLEGHPAKLLNRQAPLLDDSARLRRLGLYAGNRLSAIANDQAGFTDSET
jgi:hypothetical protein